MATHVEQDLRADQPRIGRINTHIESRGTGIGDGRDVTAQETRLVENIRNRGRDRGESSCHEITIRRHGPKYLAALHCTFSKGLSIIQRSTRSPRASRSASNTIPALERVLVHAEPEGAFRPRCAIDESARAAGGSHAGWPGDPGSGPPPTSNWVMLLR